MRERIVVRKHERINYSKNTFYTLLHTHHDKDPSLEVLTMKVWKFIR